MNDEGKDVRFSLKVGSSYQRVNSSGNKEVALIRAMTRDNLGLPHVHYSLKVFTPYDRSEDFVLLDQVRTTRSR